MKRTVTALLVACSTAAAAAPSVFVRDEAGLGWWSRPMEARILGKAAGPVTTDKLNAYLADELVYGVYSVCSLEAVEPDTFVGIDRSTQAQINETLRNVIWRVAATTPDGRRVIGQSVVFEGCGQEEPRGGALLVTDAASGEVLRWEPLGTRVGERGNTYPAWTLFLAPKHGDELFSYSGCTECGDRTYGYYDVTRRRIYTEYNGH